MICGVPLFNMIMIPFTLLLLMHSEPKAVTHDNQENTFFRSWKSGRKRSRLLTRARPCVLSWEMTRLITRWRPFIPTLETSCSFYSASTSTQMLLLTRQDLDVAAKGSMEVGTKAEPYTSKLVITLEGAGVTKMEQISKHGVAVDNVFPKWEKTTKVFHLNVQKHGCQQARQQGRWKSWTRGIPTAERETFINEVVIGEPSPRKDRVAKLSNLLSPAAIRSPMFSRMPSSKWSSLETPVSALSSAT